MVELGALLVVTVAALVAGIAEDLESDVGSQSNPNSQVQLAPQIGYVHRLYNKAISGEPVSYAFYAAIGAVTTLSVLTVTHADSFLGILLALLVSAFIAALIHAVYATQSHMGRVASQSRFGQPLYVDVLRTHTPVLMAHGFVANFSVLVLAWVLTEQNLTPFPFVVTAVIWGLALGGVGAGIGDVHLGTERYFQDRPYGSGISASHSGSVVRKAESGLRSSIDCAWFCSKFGGPLTGLAFGLVVYLNFWKDIIVTGWWSAVAGVGMIIIFIAMDLCLEKYSRTRYGPYKEAY
ncbi:MAG TPA: tetrahydromethanopterin S-methyltransferase subunit E [Candidatus Bathyarchaeia archaeon]|nr:tetrahydromethanopterin S-methyltransferase subunit E [Candidatus Bathyarchaeia archaeon]